METLRELIALAGPDGTGARFTPRHVAMLRRVLADLELAEGGETGIDAYRRRLVAADPIMAPRHVKARHAAIKGLAREALREGMLALAAELKREDVLGEAWKAALNDYSHFMKLSTGAYQPIGGPERRQRDLLAIVGTGARATARLDELVMKLMGLLEIAEYDGLAWTPETAENLRDDIRFLLAHRETFAAPRRRVGVRAAQVAQAAQAVQAVQA